MLTEEAHHMFVADSGVSRVIERTCQAMREAGITDPEDRDAVRRLGVIDLPTIQKKIILHFSLTLDLFGNEISTNATSWSTTPIPCCASATGRSSRKRCPRSPR